MFKRRKTIRLHYYYSSLAAKVTLRVVPSAKLDGDAGHGGLLAHGLLQLRIGTTSRMMLAVQEKELTVRITGEWGRKLHETGCPSVTIVPGKPC